jgi:ankyrin repeat protein
MLAIARDDSNLECVKLLLQKGANYKVEDEYGNTVHHIAALNGNNNILDYLAKNLKIELFARNEKGETPLSICQQLKN